ncbi:LysR family transcriptional regulator ArgP [Neptuniibacter caesariensis]|uniref:Chromosome replication initiation inhibitor protein n=1 Tax=Neptuniibacter caesariensis TaxID=207954 RepID=A0A7U8GRQ1_NEPCE|nr:LysR family transcriptional regulator ArgP [Neptuniibacter caesariensis]EAR60478.1 chromosome replication initiation inhibitor protein [Oceanospirillum sp. MED92] [Neptuniibacter caesariensis]
MIDYKQLQALAAILEEDSFDRAADRLHISQSAVSQRLKQLEDSIGQTLIIRGNPLQATPAGQQLLKHFRQVSLLQDELHEELSLKQADGYTQIAIGLNADSLATWFLDAVQPLLNEEKILLELKVDDQDQTHHLLKSGQVIGCISSNPKPMQGCNCIPLGIMAYRCLASPCYLAKYFPDGVNSEGFRHAPVAEFSNKDELQNRYLEKFFKIGPNEYPKHRIPSTESFFQLIIRGLACGMIPDQQSHELLANGTVIDLTPGKYLEIPLYWHIWSLKSDLYDKLTRKLTKQAWQVLSPL